MRARVHRLLHGSPYVDSRTRWELDLSAHIIDEHLQWLTNRQGARRLVGLCPHCQQYGTFDLDPHSYEIPADDGGGVIVAWVTCRRCRYGATLRVCLPLYGS